MQFISDKGDTLAIADPLSIKYIIINSNLFFYSAGYLEVLENNESLKLARKTRLNLNWERIGGYGQPSPSGRSVLLINLFLVIQGRILVSTRIFLLKKNIHTIGWINIILYLRPQKAICLSCFFQIKKAALESTEKQQN